MAVQATCSANVMPIVVRYFSDLLASSVLFASYLLPVVVVAVAVVICHGTVRMHR